MQVLKECIKTAVISAGGRGTRLKSISGETPKPLYPINGHSTLERTLDLLIEYKFEKVFILTLFKKRNFKDALKLYFERKEIQIIIIEEEQPLGECGGLWLVKNQLKGDILFINGDLIWDIDLKRFFEFHSEHKSDFTLITHTCTHPIDSDLIGEDQTKKIYKFSLKPHKIDFNGMFLGNAGIVLFNGRLINLIKPPKNKESFCHFILLNMAEYNFKVFSYNTTEFVKDIGTPDRFIKTEKFLKNNSLKSFSYKTKKKALFLDRDNTLIECKKGFYVTKLEELKLIRSNIVKIKKLRKNYDLCIILSNQPQISMGKAKWEEVITINASLINICLKLGLKIDSFNICPHHYHSGFKNEINELKQDCFCRKPKPGLFLMESFMRNIDLNQSLMIGDEKTDELAALRCDCQFLNVSELNGL